MLLLGKKSKQAVLLSACRWCPSCNAFLSLASEQERDAAEEAVRQVAPADAKIVTKRLGEYPVFVRVTVNGQNVWQKPQRSLFSKYATERSQSQREIAAAVKEALAKARM